MVRAPLFVMGLGALTAALAAILGVAAAKLSGRDQQARIRIAVTVAVLVAVVGALAVAVVTAAQAERAARLGGIVQRGVPHEGSAGP